MHPEVLNTPGQGNTCAAKDEDDEPDDFVIPVLRERLSSHLLLHSSTRKVRGGNEFKTEFKRVD